VREIRLHGSEGGGTHSVPPTPIMNAPEQNATNEPTDSTEIAMNEPTDACENMANEPTLAADVGLESLNFYECYGAEFDDRTHARRSG
jgi:hypothetical protein